ncbi:hypothetical protein HOO65_050611 [Ceratocystis lukuohia]|uniref:Uncharacterized protein n=1 Tax=Ceratocystis lukuohia TaxID=2019550 RepID=A0ABR4MGS6_9PEZI
MNFSSTQLSSGAASTPPSSVDFGFSSGINMSSPNAGSGASIAAAVASVPASNAAAVAHSASGANAPLAGQTASTEPFLRDFTLIAEAAKRAQMAILTRDIDEFSF